MNNTTNPTQSSVPSRPAASSPFCVGYISSFAVIAIIVLSGNLLSLVIFSKTKALRKRPYFLLMSLCVADFFMGVYTAFFCVGFLFYCRILAAKYYSTLARDVMQWFFLIPLFASLHTLAAISVERVVAVIFPFYYRVAGLGLHAALVTIPWLLATTYTLISLVFSEIIKQPQIGTHIMWITALICLIIIIISYIAVFIKVKSSHFKSSNHIQVLRDRRLAVTLLLVTVASVATWFPWISLQPVTLFCPTCLATLSLKYWYLLMLFVFMNSAINILIYAGRMPVFRKVLVSLVCRGSLVSVSTTSERIRSPSRDGQEPHSAYANHSPHAKDTQL